MNKAHVITFNILCLPRDTSIDVGVKCNQQVSVIRKDDNGGVA